ncbi:winged helix-turn-helix domain-containing protein [Patescibacteria group bacterium]
MVAQKKTENLKKYKDGYRKNFIKEFLEQIDHGESFTIFGMPGMGKNELFMNFGRNSEFWKELFPKKNINFIVIYLDLAKMLDINPLGFYKLLLHRIQKVVSNEIKENDIKRKVEKIYKDTQNNQDLLALFEAIEDILKLITTDSNFKICIQIHDFATLSSFNKQFFNSLKAINKINVWKITFNFSSDSDPSHILPPEILDDLHGLFFNKRVILKPLSKSDAYLVMEEWEKERGFVIPTKAKKLIHEISGGNIGYMKALNSVYQDTKKGITVFSSDNIDNLAKNPTIKARSEKFWIKLLDNYKQFLFEFIKNPNIRINSRGKYLLDTKIIIKKGLRKRVFSPLLEKYVKSLTEEVINEDIPEKIGIYIDQKTKTVFLDGKTLEKEPTSSEFKILNLLYKNKGNIVNREELAQAIWGKHTIEKYSDWAIDRTISRIRKKLGDPARKPKYIYTIKGRGLKLI